MLVVAAGCRSVSVHPPQDWEAWKARRLESVAGTNGWSTVVGLHWLAEGTNAAGSASGLPVPLPAGHAPERVGEFILREGSVRFVAAPGVTVTLSNAPVTSFAVQSDEDGQARPSTLRVRDLALTVLRRGDRHAVRVRDPESPARRAFTGLHTFPYDPRWRLAARFVAFDHPRALRVPDVTGRVQSLDSPGQVVFEADGREHRLDVVQEPGEDDLFILFRDETNGRSTYPSGRFLYVSPPDASGAVTLDFNRAYTPPCGFTAFATCPLPPPQNRLPFAVRAGERAPATHPTATP